MQIRCSELDRLYQCRHSFDLPSYKMSHAAALKGTEQHQLAEKVLREMLKTTFASQEEGYNVKIIGQHRPTIIAKGCDKLEVNTMFYICRIKKTIEYFLKIMKSVPYHEQTKLTVHIEENLSYDLEMINGKYHRLIGTPDCFIVLELHRDNNVKTMVEIFDLKNGEQPVTFANNQLDGYMFLILKNSDLIIKNNKIVNRFSHEWFVNQHIVQFEEDKINSLTFDRIPVNYWCINFQNKVLNAVLNYSWGTGKSCAFCPSKMYCHHAIKTLEQFGTLAKKDRASITNADKKEFIRQKQVIINTLKEIEEHSITFHPDWFEKKERNYKCWIDESKAPQVETPLSPAKALAANPNVRHNVKVITKTTYKLKD